MTVNEIREMYPVGTQIMLERMEGEPQMHSGLTGIVSHIDDAGQIHIRWENGSSLALNEEIDTFSKIEPTGKISVLLVEPGRTPKIIEIEDTLEAKQAIVGGYIEQSMPFDDDVAIICNKEGKLDGLHLNRAIYDNDGTMIDIIAGTFFICYAPIESDRYLSLPETLAKKYMEKFMHPEIFYRDHNGIHAMPYKAEKGK